MTLLDKFLLAALVIFLAILLTRLLPRYQRWAPIAIVLSLLVSARYLWWRVTETLNFAGGFETVLSIAVFAAELYGFAIVLHHYIIASRPTDRHADPPGPEYMPSVDVLIPTYNEGLEILYRTIVGAKAMTYARKKIWVLDDGNRPELRAMCRKLDVGYIAREENEGAKAGNLNNALRQTDGELIATFDADHVPVRTFLEETVGFFRDEKMAHVQTPQHFYNNDLFQERLHIHDYIANEQDMFYHVVLPGRDRSNSAFYCGSNAVLRRAAIDEIGGIPTSTVTEDMHTSTLLHARGWKSAFVNRDLAAGLAPESFSAYLTQRLRWARGTFQVILGERAIFRRGLSLMQRINYFATLAYWMYGFPRVVFLTAPLFFLLLGYHPLIVRSIEELLVYYVPHLALSIVGFQIVNRGLRRVFWSDVYESCISIQLALASIWFPFTLARQAKFRVTPKGKDAQKQRNRRVTFPLVVLFLLTILGVVIGTVQMVRADALLPGVFVCTAWAVYNLAVLLMSLLLLRERPQRREMIRLARRLRCAVRWEGHEIEAQTNDVSESGLSMTLDAAEVIPERVSLTIHGASGRSVDVEGRLVRCDVGKDYVLTAGVEFMGRTEEQHERLVELLFSDPDAWVGPHALTMGAPEHVMRVIRSLIVIFSPNRLLRRLRPRVYGELPASLELPDGSQVRAKTVDISVSGAAVRVAGAESVVEGDRVRLTIHWNSRERMTVTGDVRSARQAVKSERVIGLSFVETTPQQTQDLVKHLHRPEALPDPAAAGGTDPGSHT